MPRQLHHFLIGKGGVRLFLFSDFSFHFMIIKMSNSFKKITKETGVAMIVPSAESYNELVSLKVFSFSFLFT